MPVDIKMKDDREDKTRPFIDRPMLRPKSMGQRPYLVYAYKGYTPDLSGWRVIKQKLAEIDKKGNSGWFSSGKPFEKLRPDDVVKVMTSKIMRSFWPVFV